MKIIYTASFIKRFTRLPLVIQNLARSRIEMFQEYPFHMGLKTHKLHGSMKNYWALSINYKYRITYRFVSDNTVCFIAIGTHDIYD